MTYLINAFESKKCFMKIVLKWMFVSKKIKLIFPMHTRVIVPYLHY